MKIKLDTTYKKFEPFEQELPDFTILTGVNGAGKTQLLTGLAKSAIKVVDIHNVNVKYVNNTILSENEVPSNLQQTNNGDHFAKSLVMQYQMMINRLSNERSDFMMPGMSEEDYKKLRYTFEKIASICKKNIEELDEDDILNYSAINTSLHQDSIFYHNFKSLFNRYAVKVKDNDLLETQKIKYKHDHFTFLDQKEFIDAYGEAPWDFANRVLEEANINYHFEMPQLLSVSSEIEIILVENSSKRKVSFKDMSSGEKVILSLVFAMYNSQSQVRFPDLILMDEPDASLHPSMIKHFLNVIKNVFVKEKNIKVIITTHSPTTIALADEENIFVVKSPVATIEKTSKDAALKVLTEGVPTLSVNYENRRQVFVESNNDEKYYDHIYRILFRWISKDISLNFISSGVVNKNAVGIPKESCDIVKEMTTLMVGYGNKLIYGLIDWDLKKEKPKCDHIKVLGFQERYSIENYLFDPLFVAGILLREKLISFSEFGLDDDFTYSDLRGMNAEQHEIIRNSILDKLKDGLKDPDNELKDCILINGTVIKLPIWFLEIQGHHLEERYIKIYPDLGIKIKRNDESRLKLEIITKVIDDMPELLSKDILDVILELQS